MLMAFSFTLKGKAKWWKKRLPNGTITTWDLFRNTFLNEYCPPAKIIQEIEAIRTFKQEHNEPLHCSWERFKEALFNFLKHKVNNHEQLRIFYQGSDTETLRKVDFKRLISRMKTLKGIKAIRELSEHSLSWDKEGNTKIEEMDVVLDQISNFKRNMNIITKEVRMAQHKYKTPVEGRISILEETLNRFIKESLGRQKKRENMVWEIKKNYDQTFKAHASSIKKIEGRMGKIIELIQDWETGSLPSATETNPRGGTCYNN
ncbi:integrase, catalytic region, zinc finger, CCHC-type containing protein [Tanacetum coccineum]